MYKVKFKTGKLLSELSTFCIGGPARYFTEVHQIEELENVMAYAHAQKLPVLIVGKGSNCLFDDAGFDGLCILNKIQFCKHEEAVVEVGAGYSFSLLGVQTARRGWAGLEFASGIPATVGGAIFMNAGANGAETFDTLQEVTYVTETGERQLLKREDLTWGYRTSSFQQRKGAIAAAKFILAPSTEARQKQLKIISYRTATQPYSDASAGCMFRNPPQHSAGALIEQCGLKGTAVGGAEVSALHANFIVNKGNATAQEVLALTELVQKTVREKMGVELEREVRFVPSRSTLS